MNGLLDGELVAAAPAEIERRGRGQLTELVVVLVSMSSSVGPNVLGSASSP
jgi:hypothetical protein